MDGRVKPDHDSLWEGTVLASVSLRHPGGASQEATSGVHGWARRRPRNGPRLGGRGDSLWCGAAGCRSTGPHANL